MSKAETIKGVRILCKGAARRARQWHKRAAGRLRRRLERIDPENVPSCVLKGWAD